MKASTKRLCFAAASRLQNTLIGWLFDKNNSKIALNSDVARLHASKILNDANMLLPANWKIRIEFLNGWMERFKMRYRLKCRYVHGETLSANQGAITREIPRLALIVLTYAARNVWNADE